MNDATDGDEFDGIAVVFDIHGRGGLIEENVVLSTMLLHQVNRLT